MADRFHCSAYKKGAVIFRQGDPGDSMYVIRSGVVGIYSDKDGVFLSDLRRGAFFGEMSLLSGASRNASARVILDATLFRLSRDDFQELLGQNKSMGLYLSRLYARRMVGDRGAREHAAVFYAVSVTGPGLGLSHFLYSTSFHISTESKKKVLVVEPHLELVYTMDQLGLFPIPCPDTELFRLLPPNLYRSGDFNWFCHESGFTVLQVRQGFSDRLCESLPHLMEGFRQRFDLVLFSLSHYLNRVESLLVRLCDKNFLLINNTKQALPQVRKRLSQMETIAGPGLDRVRVGVSHLCGERGLPRQQLKEVLNLSETPQIWVDRCDAAFRNHIDTEKRFPIKGARAVAREIAGVRVGLALGAGAARGWAHIGVLKVLEEQGIHIDMIAGTSIGALVGGIYAASASVDHLIRSTIDLFPTKMAARRKIFDYTLPFQGVLRGRKAMGLVASAIKKADFLDLLIPAYFVGVDLFKGEQVLFETGDVSKAIRSSLSIPAIFCPYRHKGRWMVDGGLLNPVPVDVLEQKGADRVIAVCVENQGQEWVNKAKSPNIMTVISQTISIVHGRATGDFAEKADVVIYPDVQGITWDDFHKGNVLMQRGIDACEQRLDELKNMV
jgi:NTE family protein